MLVPMLVQKPNDSAQCDHRTFASSAPFPEEVLLLLKFLHFCSFYIFPGADERCFKIEVFHGGVPQKGGSSLDREGQGSEEIGG